MAERSNGCEEFALWTRRQMLGGMAAAVVLPWWLAPDATAAGRVSRSGPVGSTRDVLVHVFLRGGMDGLTACVPYGDPDLYLARPHLAVPPPGNPDGAIDLDGFVGLHPAAAPLETAYRDGRLLFVHAAGSTDPTRSHFDMFRFMELGIPGQPTSPLTSGWLARHLLSSEPAADPLLRAVAMSINLPKTLAGAPRTLPIDDLGAFKFPGNPHTGDRRRAVVQRMYEATDDWLQHAGLDSLSTIDLLGKIDFANYQPAYGASYPATTFGGQLRSTAALIKADLGVESIMLERDGWDLHSQLAGQMGKLLEEVSSALYALYLDLTDEWHRVTLVVMTEFGRRVAENASMGLDHGHGGVMILIGGHVRGGRVLTSWPGLGPGNLDNGDLKVTTDYRDVLSEVLMKRMQCRALDVVFPNHVPSFPGVIG